MIWFIGILIWAVLVAPLWIMCKMACQADEALSAENGYEYHG